MDNQGQLAEPLLLPHE